MKLICSQLLLGQVQELPHVEARRKIERDLERQHNSVTLNDVLDCLASHSDYINCELIYELVIQLENDELNKAWTAYSYKLKEACKLTLDRWLKSEVSASPETGMLTLAFQTTLTPDSLPLERVLKLQGFLCHVLEMMETEFAGYASSTVTVFFTVCISRLHHSCYFHCLAKERSLKTSPLNLPLFKESSSTVFIWTRTTSFFRLVASS